MGDRVKNFFKSLVLFFINNQPLSVLLLLFIVLFGLLSFLLTPKQYNPKIIRPAFSVSIQYQNTESEQALKRSVYELIERVKIIPGVDDIYTTIDSVGNINLMVVFTVGYDKTVAKLNLWTEVNQYGYLHNNNNLSPKIFEINPETIPVLQIVFSSSKLSLEDLRERVLALSRKLSEVKGVSETEVKGGVSPALVVAVKPNLLIDNKYTLGNLWEDLLSSQNKINIGLLKQQGYNLPITYDGRSSEVSELSDLPLSENLKLRDVADVYWGTTPNRNYVFYADKQKRGEVVMLAVSKTEGVNSPVLTRKVLSSLNELLSEDYFSDLSYRVVFNDGEVASLEIGNLLKNLLTSIVIVALVLMLFLSPRSSLVVLTIIPLTLLLVFGFGFLFGHSINRITLFALILSLGLLVDSAIVVVENIYSKLKIRNSLEYKYNRRELISEAVAEITPGLIISTITSVIVFLPMNFITGMMGSYMGPIAFFVPVALITSLLIAIIITPFISFKILSVSEKEWSITILMSNLLRRVTIAYRQLLSKILSSRKIQKNILLLSLGIFVFSLLFPLFKIVHFQMLPRADRNQFYVYIDLPADVNKHTNTKITEKITDLLLTDKDVISVQEFIATSPIVDFNGMFKGAQIRNKDYQATLRVNLTDGTKRNRSSSEIVSDLRAFLQTQDTELKKITRFMEEPPGPPVRATLVAKIFSDDKSIRTKAVDDFYKFLQTAEGVVDIYTPEKKPIIKLIYKPNRDKIKRLGISERIISGMLSVGITGLPITEVSDNESWEGIPLWLRLLDTDNNSPLKVEALPLVKNGDRTIFFNEVLSSEYGLELGQTNLEDVKTVSYVTAEVTGRPVIYTIIDLIKEINSGKWNGYEVVDWNLWGMKLKTATGDNLSLQWGGEWKMTLENFRDLGLAMLVALLLVYGVLVVKYRRFSVPAFILVTVPLGLVGIIFGFTVLDTFGNIYLTATALIGFIALIGLVVNNAIIFLEYVDKSLAEGSSYKQALLASGEARLRPIVLTSLTTILGSLTIVGDPVWSGLAWSIIFGLSLSTILTLVIYPVLLFYFSQKDIT